MLILNLLKSELKAMIKRIVLHVLKNINDIFLAALIIELFVLMIDLASQLFFTDEIMPLTNSLKQSQKK